MVARRTNSRRRRVLNEEMVRTEELPVESGAKRKSKSKQLAYSSGANRRNQLKTTDLLPKRWYSFSSVLISLLTCIVAINGLAYLAPQWQSYIGFEGVQSLSIIGKGTLSNWFVTFLLFTSSMASLQIYALRQYRRDDYQGSYRIWTWMSLLLFVASIDSAVGLRTILVSLFESLSHRAIVPYSVAAIAIPTLVVSAIAVRMLFEVRASVATIVSVVFVWLAYCSSMILETPWAQQQIAGFDTSLSFNMPLLVGNCVLCAAAGIMVAHLVYARFVYLHAHGLIEVSRREAKVKKKKTTKPKRQKRTTAKAAKKRSTRKVVETTEESNAVETEVSEPVIAKTNSKKSTKSKTTTKATTRATKTKTTKSKPAATKPAKVAKEEKQAEEKTGAALLSNLLAQSSGTAPSNSNSNSDTDSDDDPNILSMSKSQRRKKRKEAKRNRRKAA